MKKAPFLIAAPLLLVFTGADLAEDDAGQRIEDRLDRRGMASRLYL